MRTSLIIPAYNSGNFIEGTITAAVRYLESLSEPAEVIVVDDGSVDGTSAALQRLVGRHPALRLVRNSTNRGKGYAVRAGVLISKGERVVFTDADLAYPLGEIDKILAALEAGADVAVATRVAPQSRYIMSPAFFNYIYTRHLGSRLFNQLVGCLLGLRVRDCQAGLKGFRRAAADLIFQRLTVEGFAFDVEVLYIARLRNLVIREVPVEYRYFSEPSTVDFLRDSMHALIDLARMRLGGWRGIYS